MPTFCGSPLTFVLFCRLPRNTKTLSLDFKETLKLLFISLMRAFYLQSNLSRNRGIQKERTSGPIEVARQPLWPAWSVIILQENGDDGNWRLKTTQWLSKWNMSEVANFHAIVTYRTGRLYRWRGTVHSGTSPRRFGKIIRLQSEKPEPGEKPNLALLITFITFMPRLHSTVICLSS